MKVFAISDLHLSGAFPKPMSVFGSQWEGHWDKIRADWRDRVEPEDIVLIGGDISWAMQPEEARVDLASILELPGTKILLRGNHDYWWGSLTKVRSLLDDSACVLQNNAHRLGHVVFAGTRGWSIAGPASDPQDTKVFKREVQRLQLSLKEAKQLRRPGDRLVVQLHYPPFADPETPTSFTELLEEAHPDWVLYGHLHQVKPGEAPEGTVRGVSYRLVSCDYLAFSLWEIPLFGP